MPAAARPRASRAVALATVLAASGAAQADRAAADGGARDERAAGFGAVRAFVSGLRRRRVVRDVRVGERHASFDIAPTAPVAGTAVAGHVAHLVAHLFAGLVAHLVADSVAHLVAHFGTLRAPYPAVDAGAVERLSQVGGRPRDAFARCRRETATGGPDGAARAALSGAVAFSSQCARARRPGSCRSR